MIWMLQPTISTHTSMMTRISAAARPMMIPARTASPDTDTGTDTTDSSKSTDTKSNTTAVDPESLLEEGGWYDSDTGDYYDCDGDRYSLDENGNKVYY